MKQLWRGIARLFGRAIQTIIVGALAIALIAVPFAVADYTATQGTGITMASVVISLKHYFAIVICDATAGEGQCSAVNSSGQIAIQAPPSLPLPSGAATSANQSTEISSLSTIATNTAAAVPAGTNLIGNVGGMVTPAGATASNGSTTGTISATNTTLAAQSSATENVCWISIRANATAAATGNATLSDGTKTFNFTQWTAPAASGLGVTEEIFNPCIPATAVNTAWTLTSAAPGSGGVVSVAMGGWYK